VLFNLGMILSDDGRPESDGYLARLVRDYPDSPDVQEAWLRMGSDRFDRRDFAACVPYFEHAADGDNAAFAAIALYKMGWAQFANDRFESAADAFRRLMDHYAAHQDVAATMDLRDEAREYLVHSLARAGGAGAFQRYFDTLGPRDYESDILMSLGHMMRSVSLYGDAIACDELWLERYPADARALETAERMVATYRRWNRNDDAREAKLAQAERFLPGSPWFPANPGDSLRAAGNAFAQSAFRENAGYYHRRARDNDAPADWNAALSNYERYLTHWPSSGDASRMHYFAGEAAARLDAYPRSIAHFDAAFASDSTALALDAGWQRIAVTDAWYRSTRARDAAHGSDSLAVKLIAAGDTFLDRFPADSRAADIVWRKGNVAYAHGWYADAATTLETFGSRYPDDARVARAARLSGDAHYRRADFKSASRSYRLTVELAARTGEDSLVAAVRPTIAICDYQHAESVAAADTLAGEVRAAPLFVALATEWPDYPHADLALYRAGLGFASGAKKDDAIGAWEQLLKRYPRSEYARDGAVQIASAWESAGDRSRAAFAWERFSRQHPDDPDAPAALLKAGDLLEASNDMAGAEGMRDAFIQRYPADTRTVMEIRATRARRELASGSTGGIELQAYLALAEKNPEMASPAILAQVDYLRAEAMHAGYDAIRLTQPLPESIERKQQSLEAMLQQYARCTEQGVTEYSHASAHRIGQALIAFGDALMQSERPAELSGDDRLAYDDVLAEQAWGFYDRGEDVWSDMLRQAGESTDDPGNWLGQTRGALWPRIAQRFNFVPEASYPVVAATPPSPKDGE
jgi:TolA-binding protein